MAGYTKLHSTILLSSVWCESHTTRIVWIAMMALADQDGIVSASVPGLAGAAKVTLAECTEALALFLAPDPHSRTKDNEGRRVAEVDGGWHLLTHGKHRELLSREDQLAKQRARQQRYRDKKANENAPRDAGVTLRDACDDKQKQKQKQSILKIWESYCDERKRRWPKVRSLTLDDTRKSQIGARLKTFGEKRCLAAVVKFCDPRFFWGVTGAAKSQPHLLFRSVAQFETVEGADLYSAPTQGRLKIGAEPDDTEPDEKAANERNWRIIRESMGDE